MKKTTSSKSSSPHSVKKNSKKSNSANNLIYIVSALIVVLVAGILIVQMSKNKAEKVWVNSYEKCIKANGKIISTYPKQCIKKGRFIEPVPEIVDSSSWEQYKENKGFTFKCPPSWQCKKFDEDSAFIQQSHYLGITTFQINLITPQNFQNSFIRNPLYSSPVAWYADIQSKKPSAIQVDPATEIAIEGTDAKSSPKYMYYDYEQMEVFADKGVIFPAADSNPDTSVLIPLNDTDLALVFLSPGFLYTNPVVREIMNTIKAE